LLGRAGSLPIALGPHGGRPHPSGHLPWRSPWATFPFFPLNSDRLRLSDSRPCGVGARHFSANSAWCVSSWASRSSFHRSKSLSPLSSGVSLIERRNGRSRMNLTDELSGGIRDLWIRGRMGHLGYRFTRSAARTRGSQ